MEFHNPKALVPDYIILFKNEVEHIIKYRVIEIKVTL